MFIILQTLLLFTLGNASTSSWREVWHNECTWPFPQPSSISSAFQFVAETVWKWNDFLFFAKKGAVLLVALPKVIPKRCNSASPSNLYCEQCSFLRKWTECQVPIPSNLLGCITVRRISTFALFVQLKRSSSHRFVNFLAISVCWAFLWHEVPILTWYWHGHSWHHVVKSGNTHFLQF